MTAKTNAELASDIATLFPDNTSRDINASRIRTHLSNINDSYVNKGEVPTVTIYNSQSINSDSTFELVSNIFIAGKRWEIIVYSLSNPYIEARCIVRGHATAPVMPPPVEVLDYLEFVVPVSGTGLNVYNKTNSSDSYYIEIVERG